ncbi:MAG: Pseudouridine synthase [Berkelbacteria bacterium GW2011_GWA1_39_10]|uniref:Pseudouridine synthase n=1 Tax=Berkelbacteria bacterium GW2011_GWA1_39_10 TaxID=1618332 RepID=A0A0G0LIJ4_9BACT|nr:MAG: Pseudouridine synthase [Berkelbacteria bacterium GW2011_GWA1_39_10]
MNDIKTIFEDNNLIIIDKPAGVLVHPTQAKEKDTLVYWLLSKYPNIVKLNWPDLTRQGVVHRLDKDTSGLIILAKNPETLEKLQKQFQEREVKKTYLALVLGKVKPTEGKIEAMITRGETGLQKVLETTYSFSKEKIRPAVTVYKANKYYKYGDGDLTLVSAMPLTGRMHQIRVHLKHIGYPIIGDQLYNTKESRKLSKELELNRQFLHAEKLELIHPITDKIISLESKLAEDLKNILEKLN